MKEKPPQISHSENEKATSLFSTILMLISYLLLIGILSAIIHQKSTEAKKFEEVFYLSKILTVKNMVINSHNSQILLRFSSSGEPSGLEVNYKNLLKLYKNNKCEENYRPCGILDTYGNLLCIDEFFDCPINKMKVDLYSRTYDYLSKNYNNAPLSNMTYNYRFFYSNKFTNESSVVMIIKSEDEPKYITMNNFIIDTEAFKKYFGEVKLLEDIGNILGDSNDKDETKEDTDNKDTTLKIVQLLIEEESDLDLYIKGGQILIYFSIEYYNKQMDKFQKFVENKLEDFENENNIDKYFVHIGDNFYAKNYIGFQSVEDINNFLNFDYSNLYKKIFPNRISWILASISLSFVCIGFCFSLLCLCLTKMVNLFLLLVNALFFIIIAGGFFIYALLTYLKVNKNKELEKLKLIKSDAFINNFIDEFVDKCQKSGLILSSIYILGSSIFIHIVSLIFYCVFQKKYNDQ